MASKVVEGISVENASEGSTSGRDGRDKDASAFESKSWFARLERYRIASGLDATMLKLMFKGACPPTITLGLYQYTPFANQFPTLGYLAAVMSILSMATLPRAKFIQTMIITVIGFCISSCVALLTCYCSVQARLHTIVGPSTSSSGSTGTMQAVQYNSSASVVSAVLLFFNILFSNAFRLSRPTLQLPIVIYSIFGNVSGTNAPLFTTMAQSLAFVQQLMKASLAGFGIATVVNLVIFPTSSRMVVINGVSSYIDNLQKVIGSQRNYLQSMESRDMLTLVESGDGKSQAKSENEAGKLKAALASLNEVHTRVMGDLTFAKREIAFGHLNCKDLDELFRLLRSIFIPCLGLGSVADIIERVIDKRGWKDHESCDNSAQEVEEWNEIMCTLHDPFEQMTEGMSEGLLHVKYALRLSKRPKRKDSNGSDLEAQSRIAVPGDANFGEELKRRLKEFETNRREALRLWCSQKGLRVPDTIGGHNDGRGVSMHDVTSNAVNRQQLYLILYMEFLLMSAVGAVADLVSFADRKVEAGTMSCKRLLFPGRRRVKKWIRNVFEVEDSSTDHAPDTAAEGNLYSVTLGDAFKERKDPEHLPPTNSWQKCGESVCEVFRIFRTPEVHFGFRVACATLSIAILAFLEQTQIFFLQQRVFWAMIVVSVGMTMTSGDNGFKLIGRVAGTTAATALSLAIWYIAGGQGAPGAVLPVMFIFTFIEIYFLIKFPRFLIVTLLSIVTQVLIIGYELEVLKIGAAAASANGQPYYPINFLAPYRLAVVAAGCFVAFFWMYFPFPLTARSALRLQLGHTIYLLGNFYSVVHTMLNMRLQGVGGDLKDKTSPAARLEKVRNKLVGKQLAMLSQLQQHSSYIPWELSLGGKFPKKHYDSMIHQARNLLNYMALISYSTKIFAKQAGSDQGQTWVRDMGKLVDSVDVTSQEITSLLILISSSLINGCPLPPYLKVPPPYKLSTMLEALDPEILSARHLMEPGYAAFAVTQVASHLINDDLQKLLSSARALVGEVDFSFHVISTAKSEDDVSQQESGEKGKRD